VETYIHPGNRVGVLVEVNCETDLWHGRKILKLWPRNWLWHIAAANPLYVSIAISPPKWWKRKKKFTRNSPRATKGKPAEIVNKILEGKLAKYYEETCLMEQPFAKNPDIKVKDLVSQAVAKMGENVVIKRFARFGIR